MQARGNDDAFTRVRIILMDGLELDSLRTKQVALRMNRNARVELAQLMRVEQHQATTINCASLATKLHALTLTGGECQTHDYYMNIGPMFSDPLARQLYAEIASVESQHITHYGSMLNPDETPLEKLLLTEACEIWNYGVAEEVELRKDGAEIFSRSTLRARVVQRRTPDSA